MKKTRLKNLKINESSLVDKGANQMAFITLFKRDENVNKETPMKTENGVEHPAAHFGYVPDASKPSTWKLRLFDDSGEMTPKQVGMAVAALGEGFRGQKVQIPTEDLPKVKAKVRAAWKKVNPDVEEVPNVLKAESFLELIKGNISNFWHGIRKNMNMAMSLDEMIEASEAHEKWWKLTSAFDRNIMSILQDETEDQATMLTESCMQFINRAKQLAPYLQDMYKAEGCFAALEAISEDVSKAGKQISAANMERLKAAMKVLHELMGMSEEEIEMMYGEKKPKPNMEMKKFGVDDKNILKGDDHNMTFEDFMKSLNQDQQKTIQDHIAKQAQEAINKAQPNDEIKKQLDEVSKMNVELVKALDAERDIRITKEFIAKAETYKGLPVKFEDFGKLLKEISKKAPEQYDELIKTLEAANNLIEKNNKLMDEIGAGQPVESDALIKMNAKAAEIQKANPGMSREVAISKALAEDPQLYNEYLKQQ